MPASERPFEGADNRLAHYELKTLVGSGGMGAVYRAIDARDGKTVAIKLVHPHLEETEGYVERFRREAEIASLMTSPYAMRVLEFGSDKGRYYMACEFVEGIKLTDMIRQGPIEAVQTLAIAVQVAWALDDAERQRVVHRDIKPDNIIITPEIAVKVADFGIARQRGVAGLTEKGSYIGTATYSAPEQHAGGEIDTRADLYALGVTMFEMLAGQPPFRATTLFETMRMHEHVAPPFEKLVGVPRAVVSIVARCLEKSPDARFQHAAELIAAIEDARRKLTGVTPETWVAEETRRLVAARVAIPLALGAAGAALVAQAIAPGSQAVAQGVIASGAPGGLAGAAGGGTPGALAGAVGGGEPGGLAGAVGGGTPGGLAGAVGGGEPGGLAGTAGGGTAGLGGASGGGLLATMAGALGPLVTSGLAQLVAAAVIVGAVSVPGAVYLGPRASDAIGALRDRIAPSGGSVVGFKPACTPSAAAVVGPSSPDAGYAAAVLDLSNQYRGVRGQPPLRGDARLDAAAAQYAKFVAETRWWTYPQAKDHGIHTGADCNDHFDRAIAHGYPQTLVGENVMHSTLNVPPDEQFAALLGGLHEDPADPRFTQTGIACFERSASTGPTVTPPERSCVQVFAGQP